MGCCTGRCFLLTICILQMISIIERIVFDFLGYMWVPIIGDFLQIIFVFMGLISTYQYRTCILKVYAIWSLIWIAWNAFMICLYLEVGILKWDGPILNFGTGNKTWWYNNGIGCEPPTKTLEDGSSVASTSTEPVPGCLLQYYYVEVIHAGVQCLLALIGFCVSCFVIHVFTEEDDSSQPVRDELEYIKMRYRSPARHNFRFNTTYDTLNTTASSTGTGIAPQDTTTTSTTYTTTSLPADSHHNTQTDITNSSSTNVNIPSSSTTNLNANEQDGSNQRKKHPSSGSTQRKFVAYSTGAPEPGLPWSQPSQQGLHGSITSVAKNQAQQQRVSQDYGFNNSSAVQPLFSNDPPGQTII